MNHTLTLALNHPTKALERNIFIKHCRNNDNECWFEKMTDDRRGMTWR